MMLSLRSLRRATAFSLCLPFGFLAGCASVPSSVSPDQVLDLPAEFSEAENPSTESVGAPSTSTTETLDRWWLTFSDPTLSQLIEDGLEQNLDLQVAALRVDNAANQARLARADLRPQASVSLASRRSKQNFIGLPIPGAQNQILSTTSTSHGSSLSASWEPDLWGRLRAGQRAALLDAEAAAFDFDGARTSLSAQIAKLYFNRIEAAQQVALDESTLASRNQTMERIDLRYERGLAAPLELRLARAQVASVEVSLAANQQRLDAITRQLEVLLGDYPGARLSPSIELPELDGTVPAGLPAELLRRRPDLRAAESRALAAAQRVGLARAALLPSFSLTASGGTSSREISDLVSSDFSVWSLAANILQPLFQGGRLRTAVDISFNTHQQTLLQWVQLALNAFAEVEIQLSAERLTAVRVDALERALLETREAERLANDRYLAGLVTYLDLLDSQRQAFAAESQWLTARRQLLEARVDLILALGGGWDPEQATPKSRNTR